MWLRAVFLRTRQLVRSVRARPLSEVELDYVRQLLNPGQLELFVALPSYEQRHALNVCRTLVRGGYGPDRDLLQAALLHDLGKYDPTTGRTIPIWVKVANVALSRTMGRAFVKRLARSERPDHWRYLFWLQTSHEKRGARLVLAAGSSKRVVALVGGCRTLQRRGDRAAIALKWADDLN